jgi:hypothetical protein
MIELNHVHYIYEVILNDPSTCSKGVTNTDWTNNNIFMFNAYYFLLEKLDLLAFIVGCVEFSECGFTVTMRMMLIIV